MRSRFFYVFFVFLSATCAFGALNQAHLDEIEQVVEASMETFHVPGVAVGVVENGEAVWMRGYGTRQIGQDLPVTTDTLFAIGSCTKAFTSFLIGQLVDAGRLSWDDPVVAHIPDFRLYTDDLTAQVTLRDLLAHRTGLPRHDAIWYCRSLERTEALACLSHLEPACGLREKWYYNNFLYAVAGTAVERVTGDSWEEALNKQIFAPLGMKQICTRMEDLYAFDDFAYPHAELRGKLQQIPFRFPKGVEPAGGIFASVEEMLTWAHVHLKGDFEGILNPETLDEMHAPHMEMEQEYGPSVGSYGLGWFRGEYGGQPFICHGGAVDGFISDLFLVPEKRVGIVVLTNSSTDGFYACMSIRNTLLDQVLDNPKQDWVSLVSSIRDQVIEEPPEEVNVEECMEGVQCYVGVYTHPAYGSVDIFSQEGKLKASYGDRERQITIVLNRVDDQTFHGSIREMEVFGASRPIACIFSQNSVSITFEPDAQPILFSRTSSL